MKPGYALPDYAYVPGRNKRHPENAFEQIRHTASPGLSVEELTQCKAFNCGLFYLRSGFYWEAHEVLESVWMCLPENSTERRFVQGLIQLANGRLKLCMGRPKAARRLVALARELMPATDLNIVMGQRIRDVRVQIDSLEAMVRLELSGI